MVMAKRINEKSEDRREIAKAALADCLHRAWQSYVQDFGEPPHGTLLQMKALLEFIPDDVAIVSLTEALGIGIPAPGKISAFDVLKIMCARNLNIQLAPMENIAELKKVRAGTEVTIGVAGDMVGAIFKGKFLGGLILADKDQFDEIKRELEAQVK